MVTIVANKVARGVPEVGGDVLQETSARYKAVEPEQRLQRHPEAGSSWPGWPKASHAP